MDLLKSSKAHHTLQLALKHSASPFSSVVAAPTVSSKIGVV